MRRLVATRSLAALVVAALVVAVAGCTAALPDGVSVRVYQTRFDYADRVLQLSVVNEGRAPLDLRTARFDSTRFAAPAVWADGLRLEPGMTRDLRVRLPAAVCTGTTAAVDSVSLSWTVPEGGTSAATVPAVDEAGVLDRIEGEDCLDDALSEIVTIDVDPVLRVDGEGAASVAWFDLSFTPTGAAGTVAVGEAGATPLLASASGLDWPLDLTLDETTPPARVSLGPRPVRCDPHAIAEDKRGTVFPLAVRVQPAPGTPERAGDWDLAVPSALRAQLYSWIADRCGF